MLTRQLTVELCSKEKHLQGAWPCCGELCLYGGDSVLTWGGVGKARQGHPSAHMVCKHTHTQCFLRVFPLPPPVHEHKMFLCSRDPRAGPPQAGPGGSTRTDCCPNNDLYFQFSKRLCFHLQRCCLLLFLTWIKWKTIRSR